jgi:hypothetical protein
MQFSLKTSKKISDFTESKMCILAAFSTNQIVIWCILRGMPACAATLLAHAAQARATTEFAK